MNTANINMGMNNINSNIPMDNGAYVTIAHKFSPNMSASAFQVTII